MVNRVVASGVDGDFNVQEGIDVLTIGGIRDYLSNIEVVKSLANKDGFKCRFIGKGHASQRIEQYCEEQKISNVSFSGFYKKEEESNFIKTATFMNIFYPRIITHDTAMSNRFYNSLIYKKPMIVTKGTTQGDLVEKYKLGVAIDNCQNLTKELVEFVKVEDFCAYAARCNKLLGRFLQDQKTFENAIKQFVS